MFRRHFRRIARNTGAMERRQTRRNVGTRAVVAGPDGGQWMLTTNAAGRDDPRDGDDRIP